MSTQRQDNRKVTVCHRMRDLIAIVAAGAALAACGGSSSNASSSSASATAKQGGSRSSSFTAMQACLKKEGVSLPSSPAGGAGKPSSGKPPSGEVPSGGAPNGAGGVTLPSGVSRSKLQEAMKKCGAGSSFTGGPRRSFNSASAQAALAKYATCMRENGVKLPAPNTSGSGPVFNTKGIDTSSATFKKAQSKCESDLKGAFAGGGPAGGQGAPPGGGYGVPASGSEEAAEG